MWASEVAAMMHSGLDALIALVTPPPDAPAALCCDLRLAPDGVIAVDPPRYTARTAHTPFSPFLKSF